MGILINTNAVIVDNGELVVKKEGASTNLPGGSILEGMDLDKSCILNAKKDGLNIEITKTLRPRISWKKSFGGKLFPVVDINYLAELRKNV